MPKDSLKKYAIVGSLWGVVGGLIGKLASFLTQIYLGWVLSPEDFALYAIALAFAAILAGLVNGGTQKILIQRNARYDELASIVLKIAFIFNLVVMLGLGGLSYPVAYWFDAPELAPMLAIIGVATFLSTPGHVLHAKLMGELRFGVVQGLAICSHIARYSSTVLFAFFGLGPLSFVVPLLVIALLDNLLAWRVVGQLPPARELNRRVAWGIIKDSRWIMAGAFAGALIQNGGNFAVGLAADMVTLGYYFFAFQLTFAFASLIGGTLQSVIMPALTRIADDLERRRRAFVQAISVTALVANGIAIVLVIFASPLVHRLWEGKWDEAIIVVQILAFGIPALLVSWVARGSIEACGGWATVTALSVVEGVSTIVAAALGAFLGGLLVIATAVVIVKIVAGFVHVMIAEKRMGGIKNEAAYSLLAPYIAGGVSLGLGYIITHVDVFLVPNELRFSMLLAIVFIIIFFVMAVMLCRPGVAELRTVVRHLHDVLAINSSKHLL